MEKRLDSQIFIFTYKQPDFIIPENSLNTILQVGTDNLGQKIYSLADNDIKNNISNLNCVFGENTEIYYIWQQLLNNSEWQFYEYIGNTTYRRMLPFKKYTDFKILFKDYDAIAV